MDLKNILSCVDHTLLKVDSKWEDIKQICDEGIKFEVASICIPPSFVKRAQEYVKGKVKICTVIGFPNGYNTTETKIFETSNAIENGADEIDMVVNIGDLKDKNYTIIEEEVKKIKQVCNDKILKVIIETALLNEEEKIKMSKLVTSAGADYIKTSTGFSVGGATREDVALLRKEVGNNIKVKAAGGISSLIDAKDFIKLGADRLGTSKIVKIAQNEDIGREY